MTDTARNPAFAWVHGVARSDWAGAFLGQPRNRRPDLPAYPQPQREKET